MSIRISQMKDNSIYVYQARCNTSIVPKHLDTATVKTSKKFYRTTFPSDIIFAKADASNAYYQIDKLTREFKIRYRACIVSLIYLLSTIVDLIFTVLKLATFSSNTRAGPVLALTLVDIRPSFIGTRLKN